eukprot:gene5135-6969_t
MPDDEYSAITVREARALFADWRTAPALTLAVSGGPDSVALMWLAARFNIRFNDHHTQQSLRDLIDTRLVAACGNRIKAHIVWEPCNADSFVTKPGAFTDLVSAAIEDATGRRPDLNTGGGTSDARFITRYCPVIEFGLVGQTMHQVDERTPVADLEKLTTIYRGVLEPRAPEGVAVVFTGVGKINTTMATLLAIQSRKPSLVINYGTAGKITGSLRGLVEVAHVVQRDMIAEPLAPRGTTPYSPGLDRLSSGHGDVVCGTGDSFVTSVDPWLAANGVDIVDMELFAIASVCQHHALPWRAFKFITDDANDFAAEH